MRFAAGLTATGVIGWLLLEALKILMIPVTAWVMGLLAAALKIALMALAVGAALASRQSRLRRNEIPTATPPTRSTATTRLETIQASTGRYSRRTRGSTSA